MANCFGLVELTSSKLVSSLHVYKNALVYLSSSRTSGSTDARLAEALLSFVTFNVAVLAVHLQPFRLIAKHSEAAS